MAGGKGTPSASRTLEGFGKELATQSRPLRTELFSQLLEGLRTGGIGARIPIIQSAVEQSRSATSSALQQTEQSLARSGLAGTPFGERILAETRLSGEAGTGAIPSNIVREFISMAPNFALGTGNTVVSGLGDAARAQAAGSAGQAQLFGQLFGALLGAAGGAGSAAIMAPALAGCWVADALYGSCSIEALYARLYVNGPMRRTWWGRILHRVYCLVGPFVASHKGLREPLRPLFDRAVQKGKGLSYG